jgi:hypothetical protein
VLNTRRWTTRDEYLEATKTGNGEDRFTMVVEIDGAPVAWIQTTVDPMAGELHSLTLDGSVLVVTGMALLNQPPDPALFPGSAPRPGTEFEPLSVRVNCAT